MVRLRIVIITVFFLLGFELYVSYAQRNYEYKRFFNLYQQNPGMLNPAVALKDSRLELGWGYKSLTGFFSNVRDIYFSTAIKVNAGHRFFAQGTIAQESNFMFRNRAGLGYAYAIQINAQNKLLAGVQTDFVHYGFPESTAGGKATDGSFTGNLALLLRREDLDVALILDQFPKRQLIPLNFSFDIVPNWQLYTEKQWLSNQPLALNTSLWARLPVDHPFSFRLTTILNWYNKAFAGINLHESWGVSGTIGYAQTIGSNQYDFMINYFFPGPSGGNGAAFNTIEFGFIFKADTAEND